jgi:4,5-DOPA dioxygenase extradiol
MGRSKVITYTTMFDEALKDAATADPKTSQTQMAELLKRPDAKSAHPEFDHFIPIFIGTGVAGDDAGERLWTMEERSLSRAQYRLSDISAHRSQMSA